MNQRLVLLAAWSVLGVLYGCGAKQPVQKTATPPQSLPDLSVGNLTLPLRADYAVFEAGIFFPTPPKMDPLVTFRELAAQTAPELEVVFAGQKPRDLPTVFVAMPDIAQYSPPSVETLTNFGVGLSDEEKTAVASSQQVIRFAFLDRTEDALTSITRASSLMSEVAELNGAFIWDESTRQLFSKQAFSERNAAASTSVLDHVTLHAYEDRGLLRIISLGMRKFGLPDVEINHVVSNDVRDGGILVNLVCQRLVEGAQPDARGRIAIAVGEVEDARTRALADPEGEGAQGRVELSLRNGKLQDGDPNNRLIEIFFGESDDDHVHERRARALSALLGGVR